MTLQGGSFNDAISESDKQPVLLKVVSEDYHPDEVGIARKLNTAPLDGDPDNPSLRLHKILERRETPDFPGLKVLVFQLLPPACQPDFQTVGEVLDFVGQILMVGQMAAMALSVYSCEEIRMIVSRASGSCMTIK